MNQKDLKPGTDTYEMVQALTQSKEGLDILHYALGVNASYLTKKDMIKYLSDLVENTVKVADYEKKLRKDDRYDKWSFFVAHPYSKVY